MPEVANMFLDPNMNNGIGMGFPRFQQIQLHSPFVYTNGEFRRR